MTPLDTATTWLYHLGDIDAGRAADIAATGADLVVTEWASYARRETPYAAELIDAMRGTADTLVVSYISIGEAEPYRYYWQQAWETTAGRPDWIGQANPEWVDNIRVRYWDPDWQDIVFDYAERIVEQGFNGLYLDIVSAYEFWEKKDRAPGIDLRGEMAAFVAKIEAVVEAKLDATDPGRDFVIIGQNALELTRNATYLDAIDGVAKEDLRFYYEYGAPEDFAPWPRGEYRYHLDLLERVEAAGKASFVVEYVPAEKAAGAATALAAEARDLDGIGSVLYVAADRDLTAIAGDWPGVTPLPEPIFVHSGTARADTLVGGAEKELFRARGGDDRVEARGGDDILRGGAGSDLLLGGRGADMLFGQSGLDELFGQAGEDILKGGAGADLLRGQDGRDRLLGGAGADELFGGAGNDLLVGGAGGDLMAGGGGADRFVLRAGSGEDEILDFTARDRLDLGGRDYTLTELKTGLYLGIGDDGVLLRGWTLADFDADWVL